MLAIALMTALAPVVGTAVASHDGGEPDAWEQTAKLVPSGSAIAGEVVALDGETAALGARETTTTAGTKAGAVYVFERTSGSWGSPAQLTAQDAAPHDELGRSVAIDGDTVLAGTIRADTEGAAYVFEKTGGTWGESAKLTPTGAEGAPPFFGVSVAFDGDTALVGAHRDDGAADNAGAVYVFEDTSDGWVQRNKLTASDASPDDEFGVSVALDGDTALVGAHRANGGGGAAYVLENTTSGWAERQILTPPETHPRDDFGHVALDQNTAVVADRSADGVDPFLVRTGAVYVFEAVLTDDQADAKLTRGTQTSQAFGDSVAIDKSRIVVGDTIHEDAVLFEKGAGDWDRTDRFRGLDSEPSSQEGESVAISGARALVGAPGKDTPSGSDTGAAYVFGPCEEDGQLSGEIHDSIEPIAGEAAGSDTADTVHEANCHTVDGLEERLSG